ncbi:hypothetical protein TPHA_0I00510 [Tetrapisispora phaffii CBS 4417]|uniref:Dilute domain-containing protein n=1 Tax=Tetrapisispora phaffii (strain ATCC 24235 / CBS 4417 / NBRC 1672 / NRRL Y-8282 / UCD 70-5) TaxID=1071381 RepID=G8BXC9_TETPH|nr:hypothetical protein TPHA_0I00510 [Tetrapisispora phaffii CBS 4417]CCE64557.1 hypothetical protein TPHA_0I00510 [Tetrapisispora phaffii CBS 4417]
MYTEIKKDNGIYDNATTSKPVHSVNDVYEVFLDSFGTIFDERRDESVFMQKVSPNCANYDSPNFAINDFLNLPNAHDKNNNNNDKTFELEKPIKNVSHTLSNNTDELENVHTSETQELLDLLFEKKKLIIEITDRLIKHFEVPSVNECFSIEDINELLSPAAIIGNLIDIIKHYVSNSAVTELLTSITTALINHLNNVMDHLIIDYGLFWLNNVKELYFFIIEMIDTFQNSTKEKTEQYADTLAFMIEWKMMLNKLCSKVYFICISRVHSLILSICNPGGMLLKATPDINDDNFEKNFETLVTLEYPDTTDIVISLFNNLYWRMKCLQFKTTVINRIMLNVIQFFDCIYFNSIIMSVLILENDNDLYLFMNLVKLNSSVEYYNLPSPDPMPLLNEIGRLRSLTLEELQQVDKIEDITNVLTQKQLQIVLVKWKGNEKSTQNMQDFLNKNLRESADDATYLRELLTLVPSLEVINLFENLFKKVDFSVTYIPFVLDLNVIETLLKGLAEKKCEVITSFIGIKKFFDTPINRIEDESHQNDSLLDDLDLRIL